MSIYTASVVNIEMPETDDLTIHHSASGHLFAPFSLVKKVFGRRKIEPCTHRQPAKENEKGVLSEKLFHSMARDIMAKGLLPEIVKVRRASYNQDVRHGIDFWIDVAMEEGEIHSIPLQVKSSIYGMRKFIEKQSGNSAQIYVIIMDHWVNCTFLKNVLRNIINSETLRLQRIRASD